MPRRRSTGCRSSSGYSRFTASRCTVSSMTGIGCSVAKKLLKVPDDLTWQMTGVTFSYREWTCEQNRLFKIRVYTDETTRYLANGVAFRHLQDAYTALKESLNADTQRYDANGDRPRRKA